MVFVGYSGILLYLRLASQDVTKNEIPYSYFSLFQRVNESGGDDLEALERLLLERKKAADERRRQEDEDLQKRLVELEKRKKEEAERKLMKQVRSGFKD